MDLSLEAPTRPVAVFSPRAFMPGEDRLFLTDELVPGETLQGYFNRTGLALLMRGRPWRVTLDGHRIPRDMWAHVRPKHGTLIGVQAVVQGGGGGGGKNPLASLATLAIAVFNPAAALFGSGWAATTVIGSLTQGAIFNFGLGLIASAIFRPPQPNVSAAAGQVGSVQDSPTYSLSGGSNRARPYEPMPLICGTHRVFMDLGARTYTEFEGEDQYLYQVFECGYNTVTLSEFKLGQTPLSEFADVTTEVSGTDGALTLFPANVDTSAGADITNFSASYIVRVSSPNAVALAIEITGTLYAVEPGTGQIAANEISVELVYRAVGSSTWLAFDDTGLEQRVINGSRVPVRFTRWRAVAAGQYEVGVRKSSTDNTNDNSFVELAWSQLRTYQPDTADYTGRKRVAMKIRATGQLSGQVAEFSAVARAQCEAWNGSAWVTGETSNPAWWFRAVALGRFVSIGGRSTRVWGAGLAAGRVDDEAIKAWGAWCVEKSLTFNAIFDRPMSAGDMLDAIATAGRASQTWANGKLGVVYDQAAQPVSAVVGMPNINAGTFEISYQTEQLADELQVAFINPDLDWARDTVRCLVPGTTTPTRTRNIELFGCTNLDMAGRAGNLYAAQQAYRNRRYRWQMDFEGMPMKRGDVVALSHDLASFDYSGRLVEGSSAGTLVLDREVVLAAGTNYITIVKPDQTFASYAVAGGSGSTTTLTPLSALPFDPSADPDWQVFDYKFLFGATATPGRLVKIDLTQPMGADVVQIEAIDELEVFYAAEDASYIYTPPRRSFGAPQVSGLTVTETGVRAGSNYVVSLAVTWSAGNDYSGAELWAAINDGPMLSRGDTAGRRIDFIAQDGDSVSLRLVARSTLGLLGKTTVLTLDHEVDFASTFAPADVTTFLINDQTLSWLPVGDVDLAGYRVKFNYGTNTDWGAAQSLHQGLLTASPWTMPVRPVGQITLMIRAVDWAEIESVNAAVIYTDLGDPVLAKLLQTIDLEADNFPGTITGGSISGSDIVATSGTLFWNSNDDAAFWGADSAVFWPTSTYAALTYTASVTPTQAGTGSTMKIASTLAGDLQVIEYRPNGPTPFWDTDDGVPFWGDDADLFWPAPPDYQPWPGSITVTNQPYDIRVSIGGGAVQGVIDALAVYIDVPIITEVLNDVAIAATTGTRLPITAAFTGIENVQITVQADGNGAIGQRVEDKNATLGPLVTTRDAAGTAVAGLVDAVIQGWRI